MKRVLLISPHSDDELLGAGGTLLKLKEQGARIKLVLVACSDVLLRHNGATSGAQRAEEFREAAEHLSTETPVILGHQDTQLDRMGLGVLVGEMDHQLDDFQPTDFFLPEPSYHQDHRAVNRACIAAIRPTGTWCPERVYEYEAPAVLWRGPQDAFTPNVFHEIDVDRKVELFRACYPSQCTEQERGALAAQGIRKHAAYRGLQAGVESAEAFHLVREVVS